MSSSYGYICRKTSRKKHRLSPNPLLLTCARASKLPFKARKLMLDSWPLLRLVGLMFGSPVLLLGIGPDVGNMRRVLATWLLLVIPLGTFGPLALAASSSVPAAHCNRRTLAAQTAHHHCHEIAEARESTPAPSSSAAFQNTSCCVNHECCRSLVRSQWAHFSPSIVCLGTSSAGPSPVEHHSSIRSANVLAYRPVRAPPVL